MTSLLSKTLISAPIAAAAALSAVSQAPNILITPTVAPDSLIDLPPDWLLTSYHVSPCYDYAVFQQGPGRPLYANGTIEQFTNGTSNILSDGGTPPAPYGFSINSATDNEGRRNVLFNCGTGTPGVSVEKSGSDVQLVYGTGQFFVCNTTFVYGPAVALYYRESEGQTPFGCADVDLGVDCAEGSSTHEYQQDSFCVAEN